MKTKTKENLHISSIAARIGRNKWKIGTMLFSFDDIVAIQRELDEINTI